MYTFLIHGEMLQYNKWTIDQSYWLIIISIQTSPQTSYITHRISCWTWSPEINSLDKTAIIHHCIHWSLWKCNVVFHYRQSKRTTHLVMSIRCFFKNHQVKMNDSIYENEADGCDLDQSDEIVTNQMTATVTTNSTIPSTTKKVKSGHMNAAVWSNCIKWSFFGFLPRLDRYWFWF